MKVINPATIAAVRVRARHCEGEHCCEADGEVRSYRLLFAAQIILCRPCWERENRYRQARGEELGCPEHWATRDWNAAERYQPLRLSVETAAIAVIDHVRPVKASAEPTGLIALRQPDQIPTNSPGPSRGRSLAWRQAAAVRYPGAQKQKNGRPEQGSAYVSG
jgi:hypothetical protein